MDVVVSYDINGCLILYIQRENKFKSYKVMK